MAHLPLAGVSVISPLPLLSKEAKTLISFIDENLIAAISGAVITNGWGCRSPHLELLDPRSDSEKRRGSC